MLEKQTNALAENWGELQSKLEQHVQRKSSPSSSDATPQKKKKSSKDFKAKRRAHYNEYQVMKQMRGKMAKLREELATLQARVGRIRSHTAQLGTGVGAGDTVDASDSADDDDDGAEGRSSPESESQRAATPQRLSGIGYGCASHRRRRAARHGTA